MVDFWDDVLFWGIALSSMMDFDLSWSIFTLDGLYWGIASSFVLIELEDSDSYGLCWDVSIFGVRSGDRLIYWYALCVVIFSSCWLGCADLHWGIAEMESIFHWSITTLSDPLHWGKSIFWRDIRLIFYIGAFDGWYGDYWIVSCCPHFILGHSHLVRCFDIEIWFSVYDCYFWWIMELLTPWV